MSTYLNNFKPDVSKLDIDKLQTVPVDFTEFVEGSC